MEDATLVRVSNGSEKSKMISRVFSLKGVLWLGRGDTENPGLHVRSGLGKLCFEWWHNAEQYS